jgi:hypothetical protein
MVALGLLGLVLALAFYYNACQVEACIRCDWCRVVENNPPWFLLSALVTAPALILTWYWREKHKREDVATAMKNAEIANENARIAEQGQVTERFTRAVEQLGSKELPVRLGAVYALEQIIMDSEGYHWSIVEILSAYVRFRCPLDAPDPVTTNDNVPILMKPDVQAALSAIGRRNISRDPPGKRINLASCCILGANLDDASLVNASFFRSSLRGGSMRGTDFEGVDFGFASLDNQEAAGANFQDALFTSTKFSGTDMRSAKGLTAAQFWHLPLNERPPLPPDVQEALARACHAGDATPQPAAPPTAPGPGSSGP